MFGELHSDVSEARVRGRSTLVVHVLALNDPDYGVMGPKV